MTEAKIFLGLIVRAFHIQSVHERHQVTPRMEIVLRPDPGIFIRLRRR